MFDEDELLPLSGLQHLQFCERQWALIHIEQQWEENRLTAEGRVLHEKAHDSGTETRPGIRIARGLRLRSLRLGLSGQADVVEFHESLFGIELPGVNGRWQPFPVEYKRGKPKIDECDEVQVCAQALCLEEMYRAAIPAAALYYGQPRRRSEIALGPGLRDRTEELCRRMQALYRASRTPAVEYGPKCDKCSLVSRCLPRLLAKPPAVARYLARARAVGEE